MQLAEEHFRLTVASTNKNVRFSGSGSDHAVLETMANEKKPPQQLCAGPGGPKIAKNGASERSLTYLLLEMSYC
jgi:hypothetical protein